MNENFIGKFVVCRFYSAGVHAGFLESIDEAGVPSVVLKDSRRLHWWKCNKGRALSGIAQHGVAQGSRLDSVNPLMKIYGILEIIVCTDEAQKSILEYEHE